MGNQLPTQLLAIQETDAPTADDTHAVGGVDSRNLPTTVAGAGVFASLDPPTPVAVLWPEFRSAEVAVHETTFGAM